MTRTVKGFPDLGLAFTRAGVGPERSAAETVEVGQPREEFRARGTAAKGIGPGFKTDQAFLAIGEAPAGTGPPTVGGQERCR
jgi:hypothetical protein